jgi:hypothetical protein
MGGPSGKDWDPAIDYDEAQLAEMMKIVDNSIFHMARMETAEQFFARLKGRHGTRVIYDKALALARDALDSKRLSPLAAALVERHRAVVMAALHDDPVGIKPPTLEVIDACVDLANLGAAARFQSDAERERRRIAKAAAKSRKPPKTTEARRKLVKALSEKKKGGRLSKRACALRIRVELEKRGTKVSVRTVERDLEK